MKIDTRGAASGFYVLEDFAGKPDEQGVLTQLPLTVPETRAISHYAAFQRHDPNRQAREDQSIGGGANRVQGLPITRWSETIEGGLFAIIELADGNWMALLPVAGLQTLAWLAPTEAGISIKVGTLGTAAVEGDVPVLAWSSSGSVYEACHDVWRLALRHPLIRGLGRLREEKCYPEILNYLGWCSWEQYKRDIDSETLVRAAEQINTGDLPIRFLLVDDGYFCHTDAGSMMADQLLRFGPNPETFPNGWRPLLAQRRSEGVRWFGLWQNFNGYWGRIARDNQLGDALNAHLRDVSAGGRMPKATLPDAAAWYEAMLTVPRAAGFDFVKVDNQAKCLHNYEGSENAAQAAACCSQAFERASAAQVDGVINCMAHGPVCTFNTCLSAVTRCSEDYKVNDAWRAKAHLHNSYQNMLWLGPTVWGDHDMFHSSDRFAGRMMAVSKAISGGPVYLSDAPADFNPDVVRPLCDGDGRLLRPLAPAVPLPRSVTLDPFEQAAPYIVAAPLPGGAAAIVAYNFTEPTQPVSGAITPEDYVAAAGLFSGDWPEPNEGLVLYDWYGKSVEQLTDTWEFELVRFEDRFVLLCPIRDGWAVIGRTDKYLSSAAVDVLHTRADRIVLQIAEPGTVTLWRAGEMSAVDLTEGNHEIDAASLQRLNGDSNE